MRRHAAGLPRIAILLPTLAPGGAQICMMRLARAFAQAGHAVAMVVLHECAPDLGPLPPGVQLHVLGVRRAHAAVWPLLRFAAAWRPDLVLSAMPHLNIAAILTARLASPRFRVVVTEHAPIRLLVESHGGWNYRVLPMALRLLYPFADAIVGVSDGIVAELRRMVPRARRLQRIFNPISDAGIQGQAEAPVALPWPDDGAALVLGVGRLAPEKDFATLIEAFALLRADVPARLMILGDGAERARLRAQAAALGIGSEVHMPGFVANPFALMRRAGVVVLTSRFEGFGNVLVEALACGTPIVATDSPYGPREITEGGRWGALVPVGDPQAVARAIADTLRAPPGPDGLRQRASAFTTAAAVAGYVALFDLVLGRSVQPREAAVRYAARLRRSLTSK